MVNPSPFRSPYFKYSTWLGNTWLNEAIHTYLNFIVKSYDNMVHDNWISLVLQFGEKNNLNVNFILHFFVNVHAIEEFIFKFITIKWFQLWLWFIWVAFGGPFLSSLMPRFSLILTIDAP
jgi:hypothetical protein